MRPRQLKGTKGSNQYQTRGVGAVRVAASRTAVVAAVTEPEVVIPELVDGTVETTDDGTVVVHLRCGDAVHTHVHNGSRWRAQQRCDAWNGCGCLRRAARNFRDLAPADAARWAVLGVDLVSKADQWKGTDPQTIWEWKVRGADDRTIRAWAHRFTFEETQEWVAAGVTSARHAELWKQARYTPQMVAPWVDAVGYESWLSPSNVERCTKNGWTPDEVHRWREAATDAGWTGNPLPWIDEGFEPAAAVIWSNGGTVSAGEAKSWRDAGFDAEQMRRWHRVVRNPSAATNWISVGVTNPDDAAEWAGWAAQFDPKTRRNSYRDISDRRFLRAAAWITAVAARTPSDVGPWFAAKVSDHREAAGWVRFGYTPQMVQQLRQDGTRTVTVRCGGADHQVTVTWRNGHATWKVHDHDVDVEKAAAAFGGDPCSCLQAVATVKASRRQFPSHGEALAWTAATLDDPLRSPVQVRTMAAQAGFPLFDLWQQPQTRSEGQ